MRVTARIIISRRRIWLIFYVWFQFLIQMSSLGESQTCVIVLNTCARSSYRISNTVVRRLCRKWTMCHFALKTFDTRAPESIFLWKNVKLSRPWKLFEIVGIPSKHCKSYNIRDHARGLVGQPRYLNAASSRYEISCSWIFKLII